MPILGDRPVTRRPLASPRPELRDPLHASRNRLTGRLEEARGEVDETLQVGRDAALRNLTRPAHEERQSQEILVVERALVEETVLAKEMAVVGAEHDDRVVGDPQPVQRVQDLADLVVHEAGHAVVDRHVLAELVLVDEMALEAVIAEGRLLPGRVIRLRQLGQPEMGWHGIQLTREERAGLHVGGVVHRRPRLRHDVGRMRIVERRPVEERLPLPHRALDIGDGALAGPRRVMQLLGQIPGVLTLRLIRIGRPGLEVIHPVLQPLLLHPDRVMLPDEVLVTMHAGGLDVIEAVPGPVEITPEIEVAQRRHRLDRRLLLRRCERLEVRLADKRRIVSGIAQKLRKRHGVLIEFDADRPAAMLRRVLPGDDGRARWRAHRTRAISAVEARSLSGEAIQRRSRDLRIHAAERGIVLLVAGDEQEIWSIVRHHAPPNISRKKRMRP